MFRASCHYTYYVCILYDSTTNRNTNDSTPCRFSPAIRNSIFSFAIQAFYHFASFKSLLSMQLFISCFIVFTHFAFSVSFRAILYCCMVFYVILNIVYVNWCHFAYLCVMSQPVSKQTHFNWKPICSKNANYIWLM